VTLEFVPNDDRVSPPPAAMFALTMLATTSGGDAYTLREYETMFANAGFLRGEAVDVPRSPHRVIVSYSIFSSKNEPGAKGLARPGLLS